MPEAEKEFSRLEELIDYIQARAYYDEKRGDTDIIVRFGKCLVKPVKGRLNKEQEIDLLRYYVEDFRCLFFTPVSELLNKIRVEEANAFEDGNLIERLDELIRVLEGRKS